MIISHSKKFIFIKYPKSAGTSVYYNLSRQCVAGDLFGELEKDNPAFENLPLATRGLNAHATPANALHLVTDVQWRKYTKISICRNPWDRVVSSYWFTLRDVPEINRPPFAKWLMSQGRAKLDKSHFLFWPNGEPTCDLYLRYESLAEGYKQLCRQLGIEYEPLPQMKSQFRKSTTHYSSYFTSTELVEHVAKYNARTIELFGYKFERPPAQPSTKRHAIESGQ